MGYLFNKYSALAIAVQAVVCAWIMIMAFALSPAEDGYFELLFYFYMPPMYLVATLLNFKGESGMFAAVIYGMPCGIVVYGLIFGLVFSYLKSCRRKLEK